MSKGIGLVFTADTTSVEEGSRTVQSALDEVNEASRSTARSQERDFEQVDRAAKNTAKNIDFIPGVFVDWETESDSRTKRISEDIEGVESSAGDLAGTVKGSLSSAFQDWDGTAEGAVSSVGRSLEGLAGLIPGIGGLIGAGLGVVVSEWAQSWGDAAEENKKNTREMYDDMIASGDRFLSESLVQQKISEIINDSQKLDEVRQRAQDAGIALDTMLAAEAGSKSALEEVLGRVNAAVEENVELQRDGTFESQEQLVAVENQLTRLQGVQDRLNEIASAQDGVVNKAELYDRAVDAARGNLEAQQEAIQIRNRLLGETPAVVNTRLDVDDSELERKLRQDRTIRVNLEGYARNGVRVI